MPEFKEVLAAAERLQQLVPDAVLVGGTASVILGRFDGIETGVLQLRRTRPLEVTEVDVDGTRLRVPTDAEMLRVKAWMIVSRNATRDFLDVAALADRLGMGAGGAILARMDDYYADQREEGRGVTTQLVRMLADPRPYDLDEVDLRAYRELVERWQDWDQVATTCSELGSAILAAVADGDPST